MCTECKVNPRFRAIAKERSGDAPRWPSGAPQVSALPRLKRDRFTLDLFPLELVRQANGPVSLYR